MTTIKAHWEKSATNTNIRAAYVIDDTYQWIGGVEKWHRSSPYLRPFVNVRLGEWSGQMTLVQEFKISLTDMDEAMRFVEQFWEKHKSALDEMVNS